MTALYERIALNTDEFMKEWIALNERIALNELTNLPRRQRKGWGGWQRSGPKARQEAVEVLGTDADNTQRMSPVAKSPNSCRNFTDMAVLFQHAHKTSFRARPKEPERRFSLLAHLQKADTAHVGRGKCRNFDQSRFPTLLGHSRNT